MLTYSLHQIILQKNGIVRIPRENQHRHLEKIAPPCHWRFQTILTMHFLETIQKLNQF